MERIGFLKHDCVSIMSQIKHEEKRLKLKRRWLMGLTDNSESEQKQLREPKFLKHRLLSESLLREDDIFYDAVRTHVEKVFGTSADESETSRVQENLPAFDSMNMAQVLASGIDALSNKGLYLIAKVLSGDSVKFEKTRKKMKKVVKESLLKSDRNVYNLGKKETLTQLARVLNDSKNFRETCPGFFTLNAVSAATKLLDGLEKMPIQNLKAMHRKLRGVETSTILLKPYCRDGWNRGTIIDQFKKTCATRFSNLRKGIKLQEPLAKAMAIAELSLKLNPGSRNSSTTDFFNQVSPEIKSLQDELVKAIWLLEKKVVRSSELQSLKLLLGPETDVSIRSLRTAVKNMLTEYLFECGDLDSVPNSLLETLAIINRNSRGAPPRCFSKEEIEEEVECILHVSAQTKQILWDALPDYQFDHDYTDAYIEELEESDDDDDSDDDRGYGGHASETDDWQHEIKNSQIRHSSDFDYPLEGTGESMQVDSRPTATTVREKDPSCCTPNRMFNNNSETMCSDYDSITPSPYTNKSDLLSVISLNGKSNGFSPDTVSGDVKSALGEKRAHVNQYLAIQEVCDLTGMFAYNLIGHVMEGFAQEERLNLESRDILYLNGECKSVEESQEEGKNTSKQPGGNSCIVQVVKELMPSLPKNSIERLKKLMEME